MNINMKATGKINGAIYFSVFCASLYLLNLYLSSNGFWLFSLTAYVFLYTCLIFLFLFLKSDFFLIAIILLSLFSYPEFPADPYSEDFRSVFQIVKYFLVPVVFLFVRDKFNWKILLLMFLVFTISLFMPFFQGNTGSIGAELPYFVIFSAALILKFKFHKFESFFFSFISCYFYMLYPMSIFISYFNLFDLRGGVEVHFFGHWLGVITSLVVYRFLTENKGISLVFFLKLLYFILTFYQLLTSFQTIHYVMIFFAIFLALFAGSNRSISKNIILISIFISTPFLLYFLFLSLNPSDWLYLKLSQLLHLFTGDFIGGSDSITIRFAQAQAIYLQSDFYNIILGNGLSSTYRAIGDFWGYVVSFDSAYPEQQLNSGVYQYVHESLVLLFKWGGIFIFALTLFSAHATLKLYRFYSAPILTFSFFLILFASSIHTALLLFVAYNFSRVEPCLLKINHFDN